MKIIAAVFLIFIILSLASYGQDESEISFTIYGTASIPTGDFGKDIGNGAGITLTHGFNVGDKVGLAKTGFGLGVELNVKTGIAGLQWIFGASTIINGVNSDKVNAKFLSETNDTLFINTQFGKWTNVPIMSGLRYDIDLSNNLAIYGIAMGGVNLSWHPYKKVYVYNPVSTIVGPEVSENTSYDLSTNFGYQAGVGILFAHKYNLGIRYLNLGTVRYDGQQTLGSFLLTGPYFVVPSNQILGEKRSISMIEIIFGIEF